MIDIAYTWFSGLATVGGFLYFLTGFGTAYAVHCIRAKLRHRDIRISWHVAGIAIGVAAIVVSTFQAQVAYTIARENAVQARQCQQEIRAALDARAKISAENDEVSQNQRRALYEWLHGLIMPPPPYDAMPTDDPRRQEYGLKLTQHTERLLHDSFARQDVLQGQRDSHPIPDPTCGT